MGPAGQTVVWSGHCVGSVGQAVVRAGHWVMIIGHIVFCAPPVQVVTTFGQVVGKLLPHWVATAAHTVNGFVGHEVSCSGHWVVTSGQVVWAFGQRVSSFGHWVVDFGHSVAISGR